METKSCTHCKTKFDIGADDAAFYAKMQVPHPTVCPDCRFKMRALFRNEMTLYSGRTCDNCGKGIVTIYNPKSPYVVFCNTCYRSDNWDPKEYGKEYDYTKSFFEQLGELIKSVPKNALFSTTGSGATINSDYTNCVGNLKNSYLCFNSTWSEEVMYCRGITYSSNSIDCYFSKKLDNAYECVNTYTSANVAWTQNTNDALDSMFLENCANVSHCLGCVNLRNKSFCILNKQYTKEEYIDFLNEIMGSHEKMENFKTQFLSLSKRLPKRATQNIKVTDSTGNYLTECKNVKESFEIVNGEDCKWVFSGREMKDCYGTIGYSIKSELLLECSSTGYTSFAIGCWGCELSQNIEYCFSCFSGNKNLVGCDSLRNSQYCILNKQYTKEEYEKLREHIVKELTGLGIYGLMMPKELAPFGYNETIAQDNFPLSKEEALQAGFRWEDEVQETRGKGTLSASDIPDRIQDVSDEITKEVLSCTLCGRNYKVTQQELVFYKKMTLPVPRNCFYCRHHDRIRRRGPYQFWDRECAKCKKGIITNYAPERQEIVYCESCYQQEVI